METQAEPPYRELLRDAMKKAGVSRRQLSKDLAAETGNRAESEYRSLGKYLEERPAGAPPKPDGLPTPERAATLAVLLRDARLALVARPARNVRLQELAATVEDLIATVEDLKTQVAELQRQRATGQRASEGR